MNCCIKIFHFYRIIFCICKYFLFCISLYKGSVIFSESTCQNIILGNLNDFLSISKEFRNNLLTEIHIPERKSGSSSVTSIPNHIIKNGTKIFPICSIYSHRQEQRILEYFRRRYHQWEFPEGNNLQFLPMGNENEKTVIHFPNLLNKYLGKMLKYHNTDKKCP